MNPFMWLGIAFIGLFLTMVGYATIYDWYCIAHRLNPDEGSDMVSPRIVLRWLFGRERK